VDNRQGGGKRGGRRCRVRSGREKEESMWLSNGGERRRESRIFAPRGVCVVHFCESDLLSLRFPAVAVPCPCVLGLCSRPSLHGTMAKQGIRGQACGALVAGVSEKVPSSASDVGRGARWRERHIQRLARLKKKMDAENRGWCRMFSQGP
jgi:hypothetical protein